MRLNSIPFANSKITVYNRLEDIVNGKAVVVYKGTVLEGCLFQRAMADRVNGVVVSSDDEFIAQCPNDSSYLPYIDWKLNMDGYFTCNTGDVIVDGEFLHIIPYGKDCLTYLKSVDPDVKLRSFTAREARANVGIDDLAHFYWRGK